jgi:hypothetical protein
MLNVTGWTYANKMNAKKRKVTIFFLPRKFFPKIETFFLIKKLGRSCDFWLAQAELLAIQAH